ncbi:MAG: hypothetical protein HY706_01980 [Candidatus Hydrogenedentes bacterium]|nr:hypothetical protein [Candidatus Hydrogenedentota bacterium]
MTRMEGIFADFVTLAMLVSLPAWAFNAPEDQNGPLKLRIEGPSEVTQADVPLAVGVVLENSSDEALRGITYVRVIDSWRVEPAEKIEFLLEGRKSERSDFVVIADAGTYNAHYPVHAYAEFEHGGEKRFAHAILVVETKLPNPPQPRLPVEWKPVILPINKPLPLWRLPIRRVLFETFGQKPRLMPVGWFGSDGPSRGFAEFGRSVHRGEALDSVVMHPPWYQGLTGTMFVEYPILLPQETPIKVWFANAIRDHHPERGEPASDGVTFRVRVAPFDAPDDTLGEIVFERHTDAKLWQKGEADLSRFAGQSVRVQFESHPGPKNDTTCDESYWAEPKVFVGDTPPLPPPDSMPPFVSLGTVTAGDAEYEVQIAGIPFRGEICFSRGDQRLSFQGFRASVLGDVVTEWGALSVPGKITVEKGERGQRVRRSYETWAGPFELRNEYWIEGGAFRVRTWLETDVPPRPWLVAYLEDVSLGPWSQKAKRVYAGTGNVIAEPQAFELGYDGHRLSSSFVGFDFENGMSLLMAVDVPPSRLEVNPDPNHIYTLHAAHAQIWTFIPANDIWDAVKVWRELDPRRASRGVPKLAGRFVFDLWGGRYAESADALERAFAYGLTDLVVVWHNWQRWGYDYRLPDIYPPNPDLGTLEEFKRLADVCKQHDILFAPHDNYIDFYPDADEYSYEHIAFNPDQQPIRAWFNEGRKAQAYRWRPDRVQPFVERNLKLIRDSFSATAYFIDVWSSIGPHDYWTHDGEFRTRVSTRDTWGEAFAWIRDYLGADAPQISESGHDQLLGWLDGAQANHLRVGSPPSGYYSWAVWDIRCTDAERVPWLDAAYHDRFILHGAGYDPRYRGGLNSHLHGIYSDDYVATEVLTGHPAMVPEPFSRDAVRMYWLLHDLMRGLALHRIDRVGFVAGDLHRQKVTWDNGAEVWVNRGETDWEVEEHVLPQYGFYVRVRNSECGMRNEATNEGQEFCEAAIERKDGVIGEWSRSPESWYVNARPIISNRLPVRVSLESLTLQPDRVLDIGLTWRAEVPLEQNWRAFVHFVDEKGDIQFQADHDFDTPTTQWKGTYSSQGRTRVPEKFRPGQSFELRVGLYDPTTHARAAIEGYDDDSQAVRLAAILLKGESDTLSGVEWKTLAEKDDPRAARGNPTQKMIAFDGVTTNGAARLTNDAGRIVVTPLPSGQPFILRLRPDQIAGGIPEITRVSAVNENGEVQQSVEFRKDAGEIILECGPGVSAYRLE